MIDDRNILLNRRRFVAITVAIGFAGAILIFRGLADLGADETSAVWKTIYVVAGVLDLAVAGFFARVVISPTIPVTEAGLTIPWFAWRTTRELHWADIDSAEIGPAKSFWSNKPVLRLKRTKKLPVEIPKSYVTEWDELLDLVAGKVGSIPNRFG